MKNVNNLYKFIFLFLLIMTSYYFLVLDVYDFNLDALSKIMLFGCNFIIDVLFINWVDEKYLLKYNNKIDKTLIFFIVILISFFSVGQKLFLSTNNVEVNLDNLLYFLMTCFYVVPYVIVLLYFLEYFSINKEKKPIIFKSDKKLFWGIFFVISSISLILLIGVYPATMTSDTIDQWLQAVGLRQISDLHPAFMTINLRLVYLAFSSPFVFGVFQILTFSFVVSYFLVYLYKNGLNSIILILSVLLIAFSPSNYMILTTIWKDVFYTIFLLLMTLMFLKLSNEKEKFYDKKLNWFLLTLSFVFVFFYRHNGLGPTIFGLILLLFSAFQFRSKKAVALFFNIIIILFVIKRIMFSGFNVQPVPNEITNFIGLISRSSGLILQTEESLPKYTESIITKYSSLELLKYYYNPYSSDTYSFNLEMIKYRIESDRENKITNQEFLKSYLELIKIYPALVFKERLDGSNILWSIMEPEDGFNARYAYGLFSPVLNEEEWKVIKKIDIDNRLNNDNLNYWKDSTISSPYIKIASITAESNFFDMLFWRSGFYLSVLLILTLFIKKNNKNLFYMYAPLVGNVGTWIVLLSYQTFRYIWFVQIIVLFIFLSSITFNNNKTGIKEIKNKRRINEK